MVTDGWEGIKTRFARLLGRGDPHETENAAVLLEDSRSLLIRSSGAATERAQAEQAIAWKTRLADLLERYPQAEGELRRLVADVEAQGVGSTGEVKQSVTGFDNAQQAVQGHGTQLNKFGDHGEANDRAQQS